MERFTADILKDTGFNTWYEFHAAIYDSNALSATRHEYVYYKGTEERKIELPVSRNMILALAKAEIEIILEKFKIKDVKALFDLAEAEQKGLDARFTMELVERTKESQIILSRYHFTTRMIQGFLLASDPIAYY
jgi:hypothetical protein